MEAFRQYRYSGPSCFNTYKIMLDKEGKEPGQVLQRAQNIEEDNWYVLKSRAQGREDNPPFQVKQSKLLH